MNFCLPEETAQMRRAQYLAEAEHARLQRAARPRSSTVAMQLRQALGAWLILTGEQLRRDAHPEFVTSAFTRV